MKLSLNRLTTFLRGLVKFVKPTSSREQVLPNETLTSYGNPITFKVVSHNDESLRQYSLSTTFGNDESAEAFAKMYENSPLVKDTYQALQVIVTKKNSDKKHFKLDSALMLYPTTCDERHEFILVIELISMCVLRDTIVLTPVLNNKGKVVTFVSGGVDNTDLNDLLKEAIITGKQNNWTDALIKGTIAGVQEAEFGRSIIDGNKIIEDKCKQVQEDFNDFIDRLSMKDSLLQDLPIIDSFGKNTIIRGHRMGRNQDNLPVPDLKTNIFLERGAQGHNPLSIGEFHYTPGLDLSATGREVIVQERKLNVGCLPRWVVNINGHQSLVPKSNYAPSGARFIHMYCNVDPSYQDLAITQILGDISDTAYEEIEKLRLKKYPE